MDRSANSKTVSSLFAVAKSPAATVRSVSKVIVSNAQRMTNVEKAISVSRVAVKKHALIVLHAPMENFVTAVDAEIAKATASVDKARSANNKPVPKAAAKTKAVRKVRSVRLNNALQAVEMTTPVEQAESVYNHSALLAAAMTKTAAANKSANKSDAPLKPATTKPPAPVGFDVTTDAARPAPKTKSATAKYARKEPAAQAVASTKTAAKENVMQPQTNVWIAWKLLTVQKQRYAGTIAVTCASQT